MVKIDADDEGVSNLTLGKWITREVFLAYRQNLRPTSLENEQEAVVQWRFLPGWMVELAGGLIKNELDVYWLNSW